MLAQVCSYLANYFVSEAHRGQFSILDGQISLPFLKDGQRFWILGSIFSDGVYTYHDYGICDDDDTAVVGLTDEDFGGTICAMAVPPAVIALSAEISSWVEKNAEVISSPYISENVIGVYSYTKAHSTVKGTSENTPAGWEDIFSTRLKPWKKANL